MSKRARAAANERLRRELFGDGFKRHTPEQPSQVEALITQAKRLRELAARGMKPRAYLKQAEALEARARDLK